MKNLNARRGFKKDFKRMMRRGYSRAKFNDFLVLLRTDEPLPLSARPHKLVGEWLGFWECHVGPDWLLIYDTNDSTVLLARTGTHADLFE